MPMIPSPLYPYQIVDVVDLPGEQWRDIAGFEGFYQVSNLGRLRSLDRWVLDGRGRRLPKAGRVLRQKPSVAKNVRTGVPSVHLQVGLSLEGHYHYVLVRRLVYAAFVGAELPPDAVVMNRDGDGYNNRVENLVLGTRSEWARRVDARGRRTSALSYVDRSTWPKTSGGYQKQRTVGRYNQAGTLLEQYPSIAEAARRTSSDLSSISRVLRGLLKQHKGYLWRYMIEQGE